MYVGGVYKTTFNVTMKSLDDIYDQGQITIDNKSCQDKNIVNQDIVLPSFISF